MNRSDYAMSRKALDNWIALSGQGMRRAELVGNLDAREAGSAGPRRQFRVERRDVSLTDAGGTEALWTVEDDKGGQYAAVRMEDGHAKAERLRAAAEDAYARGLERKSELMRHAAPAMTM